MRGRNFALEYQRDQMKTRLKMQCSNFFNTWSYIAVSAPFRISSLRRQLGIVVYVCVANKKQLNDLSIYISL